MKVDIKKLPKAKIEVRIEVPAEEFDGCLKKAIFGLGRDLKAKGFRTGMAPKEIIEREFGSERILTEAAHLCIKENYVRAILENNISVLGQPEIQVLKMAPGNPFVFRLTAAILPEVKLPDYKKLAAETEKRKVSVEEKEIENVLSWLYKNHTNKDKKEIPSDPNDQWAKGLGKFEGLEQLKKSIREGLMLEKEIRESQRVRAEIMDKIAGESETEIPEILTEEELKRMMENLKQELPLSMNIEFEEYLIKIKKSEQELKESFLPEAKNRVKKFLVLNEIEKREKIEAAEEEIKGGVNQFLRHYSNAEQTAKGVDPAPFPSTALENPSKQADRRLRLNRFGKSEVAGWERCGVDPEKIKLYIERELINEKTLQFLESFSLKPET